jgi:NAD(P)-dependent dehydrogenase (short-subunit alcohol dehydrogenase family)
VTELSDSIVLVTGAARGIGRALTNGFLRAGGAVVAGNDEQGLAGPELWQADATPDHS